MNEALATKAAKAAFVKINVTTTPRPSGIRRFASRTSRYFDSNSVAKRLLFRYEDASA
jgi:hypothetical protein